MAAPTSCRNYVAEMTDNKFQIQVFAAGDIVPGLQALDATSNGTVEMSTPSRIITSRQRIRPLRIYSSVPFGLNARQQNSWWYQGGGEALGNEFFRSSASTLSLRNTGTRWAAGSARRSRPCRHVGPEDADRRHRGAGVAEGRRGAAAARGGDIYPALEKGTIDAAEWVGPMTTRSSASRRSRSILLSGLLGSARHPCLHQSREVESVAQELSGDPDQCHGERQ